MQISTYDVYLIQLSSAFRNSLYKCYQWVVGNTYHRNRNSCWWGTHIPDRVYGEKHISAGRGQGYVCGETHITGKHITGEHISALQRPTKATKNGERLISVTSEPNQYSALYYTLLVKRDVTILPLSFTVEGLVLEPRWGEPERVNPSLHCTVVHPCFTVAYY